LRVVVEITDKGRQASSWHAVAPKRKTTVVLIPMGRDTGEGKSRLPRERAHTAGLPPSLSSQALSQSHPSGIQPHTRLQLPEWLSRPAASLLTEVALGVPWPGGWGVGAGQACQRPGLCPQLLQFDPARRLGAGGGGANKLKAHPFFSTTRWSELVG